jgi:predicted ATPase/transcriptional regulator with XRE-family HTH domain
VGSGTGDRLGGTLRRLRQAAGLTQEELAERAGISTRAVSDTERGLRAAVHADTARRLAAALGLVGQDRETFEALARGRPTGEPPNPPGNALPEVPTPLLGRDGELEAITAALTEGGVRLLTLTGPGGIGKTRLSIEAAKRVRVSFSGGVYFVSLGEVRDAMLVAPEVAKAIGAPESGTDLHTLLAKSLAGRRALIVLDTFEHLTAAAPQVYAAMLGCPAATFLVTSRSALRLRGEQQFPVPPLGLPTDIDQVPPRLLAEWPATALFWDRALAVRPDLTLDDQAVALAADICRRLDGLPLAIELAAARVRHLPLAAVASQLTDRLRLLVGGTLDLPRRQRTIRDTVAWSHDLLDPLQARLFHHLSVFAGGWDLGSAEAVCGPGEAGDVLEGISALLDQSLVVLDHGHPQGRYYMLDVVREYAAARLAEAGEAVEVSQRHALYYLALAEEAEPNLTRAGHQDWFRQLDAERGNFRRAMAWAIERGETELALRYTAALWRFWRQLGEFTEGRRWTDSALGMADDAPASLRARALRAAAALAFPQGDYERLGTVVTYLGERAGDEVRGRVRGTRRADSAQAACRRLRGVRVPGGRHFELVVAGSLDRPAEALPAVAQRGDGLGGAGEDRVMGQVRGRPAAGHGARPAQQVDVAQAARHRPYVPVQPGDGGHRDRGRLGDRKVSHPFAGSERVRCPALVPPANAPGRRERLPEEFIIGQALPGPGKGEALDLGHQL